MRGLEVGDYVLLTERELTHELQIGAVIEDRYGSGEDCHYTLMFGDGTIKKFL